uniref:ADP-ribosylglycohydrolase n=1 Tax=Panagrolaimus sp. PS1159 TaxID=55785 RepID=A0AC35GH58_9BILA
MSNNDDKEMKRIFGAFYGQVIGDALGVTFEGQKSAYVKERMAYERRRKLNAGLDTSYVLSITGSDPPFISAGQFTDDTEMAISMARSIVAKGRYDKVDVACAYAYWLCGTNPKTTGRTTRAALRCNIMKLTDNLTSNWREELSDEQKEQIYSEISRNTKEKNANSLSNGSLMRISPLAIAFRNLNTKDLRELAKIDAGITHGNPIVGDAGATYCVALVALLKGKSKEEAFSAAYDSAETDMVRDYLKDAQSRAVPVKLYQPGPSDQKETNGQTKFMGYLGVAFQSAFYELLHAKTFASGIEDSIARGGDTDTNACIVGALIGARFGVDEIPYEWIETVKAASPCLFSYDNVRADLDMNFLSIKDVDDFVPKLAKMS